MRKILTAFLAMIFSVVSLGTSAIKDTAEKTTDAPSFEKAVEIIKKYETLHSPRHWPLIGYGHKVQTGEKYKRGVRLSEAEADALLRKDLLKFCALYRDYGQDSLLLGALAYNCGPGVVAKSSVLKKLKDGNRDIESAYLAHSKYRGKTHAQILDRRKTEFAALFVK